jgi:hypothetical protein
VHNMGILLCVAKMKDIQFRVKRFQLIKAKIFRRPVNML